MKSTKTTEKACDSQSLHHTSTQARDPTEVNMDTYTPMAGWRTPAAAKTPLSQGTAPGSCRPASNREAPPESMEATMQAQAMKDWAGENNCQRHGTSLHLRRPKDTQTGFFCRGLLIYTQSGCLIHTHTHNSPALAVQRFLVVTHCHSTQISTLNTAQLEHTGHE
jgi:hypothetical protein